MSDSKKKHSAKPRKKEVNYKEKALKVVKSFDIAKS